MEKDNSSYFKTVQTDEDILDECEAPQRDIDPRSNNENVTKRTSRHHLKNECATPQNLSVHPARYVDESKAVNNSTFENPRIVEMIHHSERNKAVIKSLFPNLTGTVPALGTNSQSQSKDTFEDIALSKKLALKQINDGLRRESQNTIKDEAKNINVFMQTDNARNDHKTTQTDPEFLSAYYNNCTINMEVNCKTLEDFVRDIKLQFEEFLNKLQLHSQFQQNSIQRERNNDKLRNNSQEKSFVNGENASSCASHNKFPNTGRNPVGNVQNIAADPCSQAIFNTANNHAGTDTNNNDNPFNAVNPMPVHGPILQVEPSPLMQPRGPYAANQLAPIRPMRERNDESNARFSPYPRQQFWPQAQSNGRQRQPPNVQEPLSFNGWQAPNPNNPRTFFTPRTFNSL